MKLRSSNILLYRARACGVSWGMSWFFGHDLSPRVRPYHCKDLKVLNGEVAQTDQNKMPEAMESKGGARRLVPRRNRRSAPRRPAQLLKRVEMERGWATYRRIVVCGKQPRQGAAYLRAIYPQATKVEADNPAANSGLARVASSGQLTLNPTV
jgi:hypothetical protein